MGTAKFVSLSGLEKLKLGGLGGGTVNTEAGLVTYINIMFVLLITVSAMLAVIFISIAGIKYMMTDLVGVKESAKGDITSSLAGLLLILASVIILQTINPCIVNFNILQSGAGDSCTVHDKK